MTQLNLTRPIIFFDIEATGLQIARDRIVELSYIKVFPDGREESKTLRFNPEMHISAEATAVNGIKDEDVADCPTFKEKSGELTAISNLAIWQALTPTSLTYRCSSKNLPEPALTLT